MKAESTENENLEINDVAGVARQKPQDNSLTLEKRQRLPMALARNTSSAQLHFFSMTPKHNYQSCKKGVKSKKQEQPTALKSFRKKTIEGVACKMHEFS